MVEIFVVAMIGFFLAQVFGGASQSASSTNFSDDESSGSAFDDDFWHRRHQSDDDDFHYTFSSINPASGLPMVGGDGGVDVAGNAYGTDSSHWDDHSMSCSSFVDDSYTSSSFEDSFSSSFDDSFSSSSYSSFDD